MITVKQMIEALQRVPDQNAQVAIHCSGLEFAITYCKSSHTYEDGRSDALMITDRGSTARLCADVEPGETYTCLLELPPPDPNVN